MRFLYVRPVAQSTDAAGEYHRCSDSAVHRSRLANSQMLRPTFVIVDRVKHLIC